MKAGRIKTMFAAILLILAVLLSACGRMPVGKSLNEQIIGSWKMDSSDGDGFFFELNFYDDNTVDWGSAQGGYAQWDIVNDNTLKLIYSETSRYSGQETWTISIENDTMTLTDEDGGTAQYLRASNEEE